MLGVSLFDYISNETLRQMSDVKDSVEATREENKPRWAGILLAWLIRSVHRESKIGNFRIQRDRLDQQYRE